MGPTSEEQNEQVLHKLHVAWSKVQIEEMLACVTDDLAYFSNIAGDADGGALVLTGKPAFRAFMEGITPHYQSTSNVRDIIWRQGTAHARIAHTVRHKETGHVLRGTFRQIATFRGNRIERIEEYYDAAKLHAFLRLVNAP